MEKVLIIGCKRTMNDICIACSRCTVGFNRKDGTFAEYAEDGAELLGILNCGDCPGAGIATRMALLKHWNGPMEELPTKIHIAPCILTGCPHKESLIAKIKAKAGIDVIEGTHPYKPQTIFS